jgi:hypothetical protein
MERRVLATKTVEYFQLREAANKKSGPTIKIRRNIRNIYIYQLDVRERA